MKYSRDSLRPPKCWPQAVQITNTSAIKIPVQKGQRLRKRLSEQNPRKKQMTTAVRCLSVAVERPSSIERTVATTCQSHQASRMVISQPDLLAAGQLAMARPRMVTTASPA